MNSFSEKKKVPTFKKKTSNKKIVMNFVPLLSSISKLKILLFFIIQLFIFYFADLTQAKFIYYPSSEITIKPTEHQHVHLDKISTSSLLPDESTTFFIFGPNLPDFSLSKTTLVISNNVFDRVVLSNDLLIENSLIRFQNVTMKFDGGIDQQTMSST
jgi:hypothetical protein